MRTLERKMKRTETTASARGRARRRGRAVGAPIHYDTLSNRIGSWGADYRVLAPTLAENGEVIRGRMQEFVCHSGLHIHSTDAVELHDLTSQIDVKPGMTIGLFLQGHLRLEIDDMGLELGGSDGNAGHMWMITRPATLRRVSRNGTRVRKIIFTFPGEWITPFVDRDSAAAAKLESFLETHLATHTWQPSKRALALAEQILNPAEGPRVLQSMTVESRAIEIITEALAQLMGIELETDDAANPVKTTTRARRIRGYVLEHLGDELGLDTIAKALGMSIGSMQRAYKAAYGTTVIEFIREMRLHRAREAMDSDGISVSEAAYLAGYSSPANFSTAFKKLFGLTPSQARN